MLVHRAYHQASFDIFTEEGIKRVCYILVPDGAVDDVCKWAGPAVLKYDCCFVVISGMDWNHDMSPWSAEGVMKKEKKFSGGGPMYLQELVSDYIPYVEQLLKLQSPVRWLMGVSLSGLLSIWSLAKTDCFAGVASISGSLWFDGFTEWLTKNPLRSSAKVYMSLGNKEKNTTDKRMSKVEDCTKETASILESKGLEVTLEMVQGTHFSPLAPRLDKAADCLLKPTDI